jgi:hypothetical protein
LQISKHTFNISSSTTVFGIDESEFVGIGMGFGGWVGIFTVVPKKIASVLKTYRRPAAFKSRVTKGS